MAAYRRIYDSPHLQADCQEPGSAAEPYAGQSSMGYLYLFIFLFARCSAESYIKQSDCAMWSVFSLDLNT